jgi:Peptidase family M13
LKGSSSTIEDGLSGDQRFFLSYAQSWRDKIREPLLRQIVLTDGHAPSQYRADCVRNLDAWYASQCRIGMACGTPIVSLRVACKASRAPGSHGPNNS